jgi:uncharacterized protein (DUF1778 family)
MRYHEGMTTPRQQLHLRLPASLIETIKAAADREGVSVNTYLVAIVSRGVEDWLATNEAPATVRASGGMTTPGGNPDEVQAA